MNHRGKIFDTQSRELILHIDGYFEQERDKTSKVLKKMIQLEKESNETNDTSETSENTASIEHATSGATTGNHDPASGVMVPKELFDEVLDLLKNANKVSERVVAAAGISKNTLSRIRGEALYARENSLKIEAPKKGKRGPALIIHDFDICAIKYTIDNMYQEEKKMPSVGKILNRIKQDLNFPGQITTLRKIMKEKLGYEFRKRTDKNNTTNEGENNIQTGDNNSEYLECNMDIAELIERPNMMTLNTAQ